MALFEKIINVESDPDLYIAKHDYITSQQGQLSIRKGDQLKITRSSDTGDWVECTNRNGDTGWLPASYIVKVDSLERHSWFFGNIAYAETELCLGSIINGSFLIRESKSKPGQFCIYHKGPHKWKTKISDFGSANKAHQAVTQGAGGLIYSAPESVPSLHRI